jgi:nitrite reductase/ring-hydroxylating ferredoxin subunit
MSLNAWVPAARLSDLREGDVVAVDAGGREIALYLIDGVPFATDNRCTHGDARLSEGFVIDHCIECPLHQGQFDIRSGAPLCDPVTEPIRTYAVRQVGDALEVRLGEAA